MIDVYQTKEILAQYKKHGWNLSRVLLSAEARKALTVAPESIFGSAEIVDSELNAVWFSRPSAGNREAWELRRLKGTAFALVEVFDEDDDEEIREEARQELQTQMLELASKQMNQKSKKKK